MKILTGLHVVTKRRRGRPSRHYVYAYRGGPCIHVADGSKPTITPEILAAQNSARRVETGVRTFDKLIDDYRASPEFDRLKDATKRDYRLWLDRLSARFGSAPVKAFSDPRMRGQIIAWRDQWAAMPRTADKASVMTATLLAWAVERGELAVNVAAGIKTLHRANKSDEVWERRHIRAMVNAPAHLRRALLLAALTGLRLGDLVRLDWASVGDKAVVLTTRKRDGRAVIPITPTLRRLLNKLEPDRDKRKGAVLRNSRAQPWTESGLGSVFQKSKPNSFDRRIHDLRGTFVTWLAIKGLTDEEIARIVGWTAKRIGDIRARYVDEARVVVSLIGRLSA